MLIYGIFEDISRLNFNEIRKVLPSLRLSEKIKSLWEDYFRFAKV